MYRPREFYTKWKKSDRERQIPYNLTYMWNLKNKTNKTKQNENRLIDTENKQVVIRKEGNGRLGKIDERD